MKHVIKLPLEFSDETLPGAENHNTSLNKHITTAQIFNDPPCVLPQMEQLFYNQSIYRLRRVDNQRTQMTAAGATGRTREFRWLFKSNRTTTM